MRQAPSRIFSAEPAAASPDRAALQRLAEQMTDIAHKMSQLNMDSPLEALENGSGQDRGELAFFQRDFSPIRPGISFLIS